MISLRFLLSVALLASGCNAFSSFGVSPKKAVSVPTFDQKTQRWSPASEEESAANGYDAIGTLLRQGPKAYLTRVTNGDQYDQAVLKFMAGEGCTYQMGQGNIDRLNENIQDWIFERNEAEKAGRKIDYVTIDKKQVTLTLVWSAGIASLLGRGIYCGITGDSYNDIFH